MPWVPNLQNVEDNSTHLVGESAVRIKLDTVSKVLSLVPGKHSIKVQ